ncbi:MAG: class I SAM-dependent methyltransferase [Actinobacteria bacterium]|nr:class I SAM-dependent methyltransferase [Actinomycetota bacterium]
MAEKFDASHASKLENPARLVELPPAKLVQLLRLTGAETVIDFGAGTGMYSLPIAESLPDGTLFAVDEQQALLDRLRQKLRERPPAGHVEPVLSLDDHVPLPDGAADRILMINVLHHIYDEPVALAEVTRLLAPGGLLVLVEFARMERPVGPPNDHVLAAEELHAAIEGMGLTELAAYEPGEIGLYHVAIVAQKPAS